MMDTVVIRPRTALDAQLFLAFAKRIGAPAKAIDTEELEDRILARFIEEGLKTPSMRREEVMKILDE